MASSWPQAPLAATPTEYWSESQSTCSWAVSWGAASSPVASPRASDSGKKRSADGGLATEGAVSGGARSFNRFGDNTKDSAAAENAIMQMRKMGVAVPVRFADIAGCDQALVQLKECMEMPMKRPKLFAALGVAPPTGVILYGPSGCGKTLIAQAIGNELGCHIVKIDSAELVSDLAGESELMLRAAFEEARQKQPAVIVIDDIDAAAPARERGAGTSVETRLVTTLQTLMDKVHAGWIPQKRDPGEEPWAPDRVCILGATRQINNVDSALRRAGRFEREVSVRCPDAAGRREMLSVMTRDMVLDDDVELSKVGDQAQGFVGADLAALCRHAGLTAIREAVSLASGKPVIGSDDVPRAGWDDAKITELSQKASQADFVLPVAARHFAAALASRTSRPSVLKEHVPVGQVGRRGWDDVGGLAAQKRDLEELISYPILHHQKFVALGVKPPRGVLLYGPPGGGKSLVAQAAAAEVGCNFLCVRGPELLSPYVGQSEARLRELFSAARQAAPSIIFFDDIDAIALQRGGMSGGVGQKGADRLLNQLLVETDGLDSGLSGDKVVIVMAATSRPEVIDRALMRPGRLDQLLYVPIPEDSAERRDVLRVVSRKLPLGVNGPDCVDLDALADQADGFSAADLQALCCLAGELALSDCLTRATVQKAAAAELMTDGGEQEQGQNADQVNAAEDVVEQRHFLAALEQSHRSVSASEVSRYDLICKGLREGGISELNDLPTTENVTETADANTTAPLGAIANAGSVSGLTEEAPSAQLVSAGHEEAEGEEEGVAQRRMVAEGEAHFLSSRAGSGAAKRAQLTAEEQEAEATEQAGAQEAALLRASVDMLTSRLKELTNKTEKDREVWQKAWDAVNFHGLQLGGASGHVLPTGEQIGAWVTRMAAEEATSGAGSGEDDDEEFMDDVSE